MTCTPWNRVAALGVSVVVPTRDRALLVRRALASAFGQSLPPLEILVVDDGSTDQTEAAVRAAFPRARYIRQPHRGVSAARNAGIQQARGGWLAFLDSDDEWLPQKLERQLAALGASPDHRLCHCDEIWIRRGRRVNPRQRHRKVGGWIFERCLELCAVSPSSVVVHRSLFEDHGWFDESLPACEDYDFWLRVCSREAVLFVEEPLVVKHGGHADQLSSRFPSMDRFRIQALEKLLAAGELSDDQRRAALAALLRKIDIHVGGAAKRGRREEVRRYQARRSRYARQLQGLSGGRPDPGPSAAGSRRWADEERRAACLTGSGVS